MTRFALAAALVLPAQLACIAKPVPSPAASRSWQPPAIVYPATRVVDVADDYHGMRVADPYRWLEDIESDEVRRWAATQDAIFAQQVRSDPLRAQLTARMMALATPWDQLPEPTPAKPGALELRLTPGPGDDHRILTVGGTGTVTRVLVDPRDFGPTMDITRFHLSPDERYVAYALSERGSEWVTTRIRRVADGTDLPESIEGMLFAAPVWTRDGGGFFYVRYRRADAAARTMFGDAAVHHHRVGTPQGTDRVIHRTPPGNVELAIELDLTADGRHLLIREGAGAHFGDLGWAVSRMLLLDLRDGMQPDPAGPVTAVTTDRSSGYHLVAQRDTILLIHTDRGAPRRRLVAVNVGDPAPDRWREVIPETTAVLDRVVEVGDRLVGIYLENVQHRIRIFDRDGTPLRSLVLPPFSSVSRVGQGRRLSELEVVSSSFLRPPAVTRYDMTGSAPPEMRVPATDFDASAYEEKQVWYPSKGTMIPMFLVHRRGISLDNSHPTMLVGYGASGQVMAPEYAENALAWLEQGGIVALPSLRGGGELGRAWYDAAILGRKQTTFDDFIAAAEWLIANGYTSSSKLAIRGVSNGGLLVAAVMTQRPELFAVAIAEVPVLDVLRYDRGRHRAQFGNVADPSHFPFMLAYAPLQRVKAGTCYPATLVTTTMNDERAPAWQALKFAAALQAAQGCDRPILLRAHASGGHGGDRGPNAWIEDVAEATAFAMRQLGMSPR